MTYKIIDIDLSHSRINQVYNLSGDSIKVLNATSDCFIQFDDASQDPINLLLVDEIKIKFKKFYLSNVGIKDQSIKIIVSENFNLDDRISIPEYIKSPSTLPGFGFRIPITIPHTKVIVNEINCPIYVRLRQNNFDFTRARNDGLDVCFTKDNGLTLLDFERDRHDGINLKGDYMVKIPYIPSSIDTKFYMYYGNPTANDISNPNAVWDTNLIARWSLKENPADLAPQMKDSTINANHGSSHGGMTAANSVEGQIDRALSFDGINDFVNIPDVILPNPYAFTISGWFFNKGENSTPENWQMIIDLRRQYNIYIDFFEQDSVNYPGAAHFWIFDGTTIHDLFSSNLIINTWYFFAASWDGTNMRLYINGVEVSNKLASNPSAVSRSHSRIGKDHRGVNRGWFNGIIDEVRISNIARSVSWINLQYQSQNNTLLNFGIEESV